MNTTRSVSDKPGQASLSERIYKQCTEIYTEVCTALRYRAAWAAEGLASTASYCKTKFSWSTTAWGKSKKPGMWKLRDTKNGRNQAQRIQYTKELLYTCCLII